MSQFDYIKEIAKSGLENDQEKLLVLLNELIKYSKKTKKVNFALQLQSILKDSLRNKQVSGMSLVDSPKHILREEDREVKDFILEKLTSDYDFENLVCSNHVKDELEHFVQEHQNIEVLNKFDLPVANKLLFYGPSGCGKTLASYVLAGELEKMMLVINLGAIVSSKLGETSKNLSKIFKRAASEDCIIFIDEFDSIGKIRDYNQDHGEMKRVVNTILQLFDYLPQNSVIIAATNQIDMIDDALLRRFDVKLNLELPDIEHIKQLSARTLKSGVFKPDNLNRFNKIIDKSLGLSYYTIQRTLITAIKRSIFKHKGAKSDLNTFDTSLWLELINKEKK